MAIKERTGLDVLVKKSRKWNSKLNGWEYVWNITVVAWLHATSGTTCNRWHDRCGMTWNRSITCGMTLWWHTTSGELTPEATGSALYVCIWNFKRWKIFRCLRWRFCRPVSLDSWLAAVLVEKSLLHRFSSLIAWVLFCLTRAKPLS